MDYTLRVRLNEDEVSTLHAACCNATAHRGELTNQSDLVRAWIMAGCPTTPEPRSKGSWVHRNLPEDAACWDGSLVHNENGKGAPGAKFYLRPKSAEEFLSSK